MSRVVILLAGALLHALAACDAHAQWNVARFGEPARNRTYATFGLDPAFVGTAGYGRVVRVKAHDFQLTGEAGIATAHVDVRDFRARLGVRTSIARWRSVHLTGSAGAIARGTDNSIYRGFNWGADVGTTLGVYRRRWFAAGEASKDKAIITHLTMSDFYREHFYPDAKDGWYLDAGGTVRYGLTGGVSLGRYEVSGRAGWQRTEHWGALASPMYASVGVGFGF